MFKTIIQVLAIILYIFGLMAITGSVFAGLIFGIVEGSFLVALFTFVKCILFGFIFMIIAGALEILEMNI